MSTNKIFLGVQFKLAVNTQKVDSIDWSLYETALDNANYF